MIDTMRAVVIARYGGSWRGIKPKVAAEHGAVGCLIYSDPRDDGYFVDDVFPNGPMRNKDGAQRGSVMDMPVYPGDPLTPGVPATPGAKRLALSEARTLTKIRKAVRRGAKIPTGQQIKQIIALQGSFTRPARQYAVYADFGRDSDTNLVGYWRTVILDSDLSIVAVVGENEYTHIQPRSVGDVDGDGLDEVWVGLTGYEGHHAGLIYWRGGAGNDAFGTIENAYDGA